VPTDTTPTAILAARAIEALRTPDAALARVPNTFRQSIADVIEALLHQNEAEQQVVDHALRWQRSDRLHTRAEVIEAEHALIETLEAARVAAESRRNPRTAVEARPRPLKPWAKYIND
jgi:hypothetical protein